MNGTFDPYQRCVKTKIFYCVYDTKCCAGGQIPPKDHLQFFHCPPCDEKTIEALMEKAHSDIYNKLSWFNSAQGSALRLFNRGDHHMVTVTPDERGFFLFAVGAVRMNLRGQEVGCIVISVVYLPVSLRTLKKNCEFVALTTYTQLLSIFSTNANI